MRQHRTIVRLRPINRWFKVAGNASTYLGAWVYPGQRHSWHLVSLGEVSSWCLLEISSFLIVADLMQVRSRCSAKSEGPGTAAANI